jgi:fumarate hydratase subunit beta
MVWLKVRHATLSYSLKCFVEREGISLKSLVTPITDDVVRTLKLGEIITVSGYIYTGRDAVLPKILALLKNNEITKLGIDLQGGAVFHTAVSPAGVGPTSSNKVEIEASIAELSQAGLKLHLGKGILKKGTIEALHKYNSFFATVPPVTALLTSRISEKLVVAFSEEGIEAFHRLKVEGLPAVISAIHGEAIFGKQL